MLSDKTSKQELLYVHDDEHKVSTRKTKRVVKLKNGAIMCKSPIPSPLKQGKYE